jgi:DNA-binding NarL/FixJ family response regulator
VGRQLTKDELRRCDAVLDVVVAAPSLPEFMQQTLAALDEHFGHGVGEFMLALSEDAMPGYRAYAGTDHGHAPYVMEAYFERWANRDALTSAPARATYVRTGRAAVAELYHLLDESRRGYVDGFLRSFDEHEQVSFRLAAGWSDGYLTLARLEDDAVLRHLVPELTAQLRERLPRGLDADVTVREGQVAELVALGFTNREIAGVLHVEEDTVKKHVSRAMERIGVSRRTQLAVAWATGVVLSLPTEAARPGVSGVR